jgi:uncharacterized protein (TIGR03663 family)
MHGDEAVHAYRFGQLLEANNYRYDPTEFHGPTLNYFTLIPALLSGQHTYASLTEITLRIVPVFFGLVLVLMPLLLLDGLGRPVAAVACALTAISPAFVFYSRYYIPEMLLVCFTFGMIASGYRYARSQNWLWALRTGVFAALSFATKETSVIAFAAIIIALAIVLLVHKEDKPTLKLVCRGHLVLAIAGAVVVWGLFYSSFFNNPAGLLDSFRAYAIYFERAGHNQLHIHPWYYYLQLLIYNRSAMELTWTEGFVVLMALVGLIFIISGRNVLGLDANLLKFIAGYTIVMTVVYSAIPYKTPWCLLSFYQGMIILAAVAIVAVLKSLRLAMSRIIMAAFFIVFATDVGLQGYMAGRFFNIELGNPYVYAHPTKDVLTIARRVEEVSRAYPAGREMPIWVLCPQGDYWPLPWYLRSFKNVGYYNDVNEILLPAPVVIASAGFQDRLIGRLFDISPAGEKNLYVPLFDKGIELRPQVELRGYVTKDLWDQYQQKE